MRRPDKGASANLSPWRGGRRGSGGLGGPRAFRATAQRAAKEIAWPVVLLVCGIVTYIALLQRLGVVDSLGETIAAVGAPLMAALLICYVGGVVSAFASTTGILGALMPLATPFLASGSITTTGLVVALASASTIVDASPFSTNGALVVANAPEPLRSDSPGRYPPGRGCLSGTSSRRRR
ncbi:SLC13 family permease [Streptomyces nojiriensis]|uniref:SLC13 family permease n=1 Tax=Streptomyces nojiriensis TaxID=66374 RepID=UPI00367E45F2